jgi:dipeptidyl aminopeptidase/acylaminoacyl peptidase
VTPFPRTAAALLAAVLLAAAAPLASAADKRPIQVDDLFKFKRVAAPRISPDGKQVVYQVTSVDLEANKSSAALYVADADGKSLPKQLTDPKGKKDTTPRWSPDGKQILFESTRTGTSQLWVVPAAGGEPKQLTDVSTGAENGIWSPDGSHVAFVSAVYPEFSDKPFAESDKLNKAKDDEIEKSPVKARTFTKLFYRHWVEYVGDKRQHLLVCNANGSDCRDVTPGDRDAYPTSTTFGTDTDFTFSPDGKFLVFTAVPEKNEAWSTNYDVCRVSITNTSPKWETLTKGNPAADGSPQFSPDGKKLAWRAQKRAGYEADNWDILVADCNPDGTLTGQPTAMIGKNLQFSVEEFVWATIWGKERTHPGFLFTTDHHGSRPIFAQIIGGPLFVDVAADDGTCGSLSANKDGTRFAYTVARMTAPAEVYVSSMSEAVGFEPPNVSRANAALLAELDLPKPESVEVPVEGGVKMQMWVLKPPGFDPNKKWPVAYLVHGGPQGAWEDGWSYRWNPEVWAARGYVVVLPNPRGSTGFGQKFVDEISGDWGGKCYRDLVAGLDYVDALPYVDKDRKAAAGASFGGYMMNWFAVNDISPRFKCLITHCSVWNFESMWGTTDELWFDEFEHGGLPWEIPHKYREFSPHTRAGNLGKYKTPMLVIHNDLDFRCPIGQGHELFSALQRQGVPSRMVNFPDEGHWVLKPQNSRYWHKEVFGWLEKYCPPGGK